MNIIQSILFFIRDIGTYSGAVVTVLGLVTLIVKPIRNKFINWIQKTTHSAEHDVLLLEFKNTVEKHDERDDIILDELQINREALQCILRNDIVRLYYKYLIDKKLPSYQKENLVILYDQYLALKGNSFVSQIYSEMTNWEVIPR